MTIARSTTSRWETSRSWGPWVLAGSLALAVGSASAAVYVVRPDGTGDFPSIQRAVDAAVDGDVIELTDGTFERIRNRDVDFLGKAITIRSQSGDPTRCIIDCGGSVSEPHRGFLFVHGEGNDSVLEGVTVQNGYGPDADGFSIGGAVLCKEASPTIRSCRFIRNGAIMGGAIASTYDPSSTLPRSDGRRLLLVDDFRQSSEADGEDSVGHDERITRTERAGESALETAGDSRLSQ